MAKHVYLVGEMSANYWSIYLTNNPVTIVPSTNYWTPAAVICAIDFAFDKEVEWEQNRKQPDGSVIAWEPAEETAKKIWANEPEELAKKLKEIEDFTVKFKNYGFKLAQSFDRHEDYDYSVEDETHKGVFFGIDNR